MKKVLLIALVVVSIAASAWYFLIYRDQAAQKQTMTDMRNVGGALFSWLTDQVGSIPEEPILVSYSANLAHQENYTILVRAEQTPRVMPATLALPVLQGNQTADVTTYTKRSVEEMEKLLVPAYISHIPETDGWGNAYEYYVNDNVLGATVLLIRSPGRDGTFSGSTYQVGRFEPSNYDEDIVWIDGFFFRYPEAQP